MCLSPRSPSRLGIMKSWNIEVGRDPQDRRGSSAPGGVRVGIASLERREREWDFSRLPWPVTRGIGIVNPYSRPGSCGRNPNVLTSIFLLLMVMYREHQEFLASLGVVCGWMDPSWWSSELMFPAGMLCSLGAPSSVGCILTCKS